MYDPPVKITFDEAKFFSIDNEIFQCIQNANVDVDRDELLRALKYDRDQYNKGYVDGRADAIAELMQWIKACPAMKKGGTDEQ